MRRGAKEKTLSRAQFKTELELPSSPENFTLNKSVTYVYFLQLKFVRLIRTNLVLRALLPDLANGWRRRGPPKMSELGRLGISYGNLNPLTAAAPSLRFIGANKLSRTSSADIFNYGIVFSPLLSWPYRSSHHQRRFDKDKYAGMIRKVRPKQEPPQRY